MNAQNELKMLMSFDDECWFDIYVNFWMQRTFDAKNNRVFRWTKSRFIRILNTAILSKTWLVA